MQVEKTSLNYTKPQSTLTNQNQAKGTGISRTHAQSFGHVSGLMDMIDRGGLVASFLIQDFFGLNIPRTITGLYRNKDITGEYNYQEATEVALRECISGPVLFAVPMTMLYGIKKMYGKANDVPAKVLNVMGSNFSEQVSDKTMEQLGSKAEIKEAFYHDTFKNILKNTFNETTSEEKIEKEAKYFTTELLEYEKMVQEKKTKGFFDKLKGKRVDGTAEDRLSDLVAHFAEIKKENTGSASADFLSAKLTSKNSEISKPLSKLVVDMKNFIEDAGDSVAQQAKKGVVGDYLKQYVQKFTEVRAGSRAMVNLAMIVGTIAVGALVPKIYQLSDTNPGTKGLDNYTGDANSKTPAFKGKQKLNNEKNSKGKNVSFGSVKESLANIGKKVTKKEGFWSKLSDEFEYSSYNLSFAGLLTVCGLGTLLPRLVTAREENEYKEILLRDTVTIGAIACAAKILQQIFAKVCTKFSGLALSIKPNGVKDNVLSKALSYLRPVKGHSVLTSEQLKTKYTNIDKYKDKAAGFARFIDEQGGDVKKAFSADSEAHGLLKTIYDKSANAAKKDFETAKNADIISALEDVIRGEKAPDTLEKLYEIFRSDKNKLLAKAKNLNSYFNFAVLFGVVPVILGYLIPAFNESLTKKRELNKNKAKLNESNAANNQNNNSVSTAQDAQNKQNKAGAMVSSKSSAVQPSGKAKSVELSNPKTFAEFDKMVEK